MEIAKYYQNPKMRNLVHLILLRGWVFLAFFAYMAIQGDFSTWNNLTVSFAFNVGVYFLARTRHFRTAALAVILEGVLAASMVVLYHPTPTNVVGASLLLILGPLIAIEVLNSRQALVSIFATAAGFGIIFSQSSSSPTEVVNVVLVNVTLAGLAVMTGAMAKSQDSRAVSETAETHEPPQVGGLTVEVANITGPSTSDSSGPSSGESSTMAA